MIKFALNIKLRYMIRTVLSLLFFIGFLVNGNLIAQSCSGEAVEIGGADGSFESCASIAASNIPGDITCGGWFNGQGSADAREGDNKFIGRFAIVDSENIDGTSSTDGIDVCNMSLGKNFSQGAFIVQDDENDKGKQNFKVVPWENIASSFNPPLSNNNKWSIRY